MTGSTSGVSGRGRSESISYGLYIPFQARHQEEKKEEEGEGEEVEDEEDRPDGGPDDSSLLISFFAYVNAYVIWNGLVRSYFTNMHPLITFFLCCFSLILCC
ncbi:hypothetical protein Dimus_038376 [Dionaea muscipula]